MLAVILKAMPGHVEQRCKISKSTVEPLTNDHPHLRPPAFYNRMFIDGMSTLYKQPLTNDHPADATMAILILPLTNDQTAHFLT